MTNKLAKRGGRAMLAGTPEFRRRPVRAPVDPDAVVPATREETMPAGLLAVVAGFFALAISAKLGVMLLYGDAVAHLGIARRIVDTRNPGLGNWGGVWLPLPHLLMLPFVGRMEWWQNGMAGAWPSLICYVIAVMGMYRLARRLVPRGWAMVATAFFGLNANLLYLSATPMTEPLFLALLVWIVLLTMEMVEALRGGFAAVAGARMLLLGVLIFAAVMTRYDGWVLGAAVWCVAAWQVWKRPAMRARVGTAFAVFTVLAVAGPLLWFWYNHVFGHDWLDFMRGPYSAKEIDRKTSPPGAHKYWGWHNPAWSLMLYARTAQVDAAWWETGWLVAGAALWGTWKAWKAGVNGAAYLLWLPLPFYVYSISYGSVPIFIPQLYPHSFYNSRYGTEMLPVLAMFLAYALWMLARRNPLAMRVGAGGGADAGGGEHDPDAACDAAGAAGGQGELAGAAGARGAAGQADGRLSAGSDDPDRQLVACGGAADGGDSAAADDWTGRLLPVAGRAGEAGGDGGLRGCGGGR